MKKLTSLLIGCSLALTGAALAQQPVEQQSPSKGKQPREKKAPAAEAKPGPNAAKPREKPAKQPGAMKERGATDERAATKEPGAGKGRKAPGSEESAAAPRTDVSGQPAGAPSPGAKRQAEQQKKGMKEPAAAPKTHAPPAADTAGAAPPVSAAGQQNARAKGAGAAKKPDPQKVQQIKSQHANFRAQPKPQQVPAVTYNQNYRIEGSEQWQGPQYQVFRSYRPEWHDEGWYRSHYNRVELIGGGYYFWNNGYWYPAWGYSPSAQYYAYDGPIYVGQRAEPPDKVIADVQAVLQEMGYYRGEVDGLLGPLTREALTAYQADQGLTTTAAIDEPTLESLGMG
jgi:putative peptidoglycan binding protein